MKKYPRAKISRHATLDGWVIDLIQRANAKPKRVAATYASIHWATRAARLQLGLPASPERKPQPHARAEPAIDLSTVAAHTAVSRAPQSGRSPNGTRAAGTCNTCHRPMRPAGTRAAEHPGTTLRQREGLCQPCNHKAKVNQAGQS